MDGDSLGRTISNSSHVPQEMGVVVPAEASEDEIKAAALQAVAAQLEGKEPKKVIVVRKQLVNIVV